MAKQFLPLLKPQNIDELKSLILQIMEDNDSKLEKIIDNRQDQASQRGQDFTIQDLNDLLSQQCLQKQKIISNLSHFSLSLMNTIDVLWQDNEDLQYRIKDQRDIIQQIESHLREMGKESQYLKNKLHQTFNDLQKMEEQKLQVEEYLSSIIAKHDSSFCLNKSMRKNKKTDEEKVIEQENIIHQQPEMYFTGNYIQDNPIFDPNLDVSIHSSQECPQSKTITTDKENFDFANRKTSEQMDLLQQSVIKNSISVLRRFTLSDQIQSRLPILQEEQQNVRFMSKSHRFSLSNQVSLQIIEDPKKQYETDQIKPVNYHSLVQIPSFEKPKTRELKTSNEKANVTVATGTQIAKTKDSEKFEYDQFSTLRSNPSFDSLMLNRQSSAVMNPTLDRSTSVISFVTQTTKIIQTDPPKVQNCKQKQLKKLQKKSIGIDTSTIKSNSVINNKPQTKDIRFKKQKTEVKSLTQQKGQQLEGRKSFGQLNIIHYAQIQTQN